MIITLVRDKQKGFTLVTYADIEHKQYRQIIADDKELYAVLLDDATVTDDIYALDDNDNWNYYITNLINKARKVYNK